MRSILAAAARSVLYAACAWACSLPPSDPGEWPPKEWTKTTTLSGRLLLSGDMTGVTFPMNAVVTVSHCCGADDGAILVGRQEISLVGPEPTPYAVTVSPFATVTAYTISVDVLGVDPSKPGVSCSWVERHTLEERGSVVDLTAACISEPER